MSKIICIANQIADTGKTATAVSLAASFALMEKSTLLIDCDPQAAATRWLGLDEKKLDLSLYHAFIGRASFADIIVSHQIPCLSILPSQIGLFQVEHQLAVKPGKEMILRKQVQKISSSYDYIIIDSPPTLGFFTVCAMASADFMMIPVRYGLNETSALNHLLEVADMVRNELNPDLKTIGRILTFYGGLTHSEQCFPVNIGKGNTGKLFSTTIPNDRIFQEAFNNGRPIQLHDIMARGTQSYLDLAVEFIGLMGDN